MATRIAEERGWTIGSEIGWHIRFERQFTDETRLLVVTEGILTAYLQDDPLLSDVTTLVVDEFHERSVHADLGLALARQAWLARHRPAHPRDVGDARSRAGRGVSWRLPDDRRAGLAASADDRVRARRDVASALRSAAPHDGQRAVLPARRARDRRRDQRHAATLAGRYDAELCRSTARSTQPHRTRALVAGIEPRRRIIVATNIAETSLTVRGVSAVIDCGLAQGRPLRRRSRRRFADDRAHHARQRRSAGRPRRPPRSRTGPATVGCARSPAPASRSGDPSRRSLRPAAVDPRWGAQPEAFEWFDRRTTIA